MMQKDYKLHKNNNQLTNYNKTTKNTKKCNLKKKY